MSRGHKLIAAAIVAAGLLVAVAAWPKDECAAWHARMDEAFTNSFASADGDRAYWAARADKPKGCK